MRQRSTIFNGRMIRAILARKKRQTRRLDGLKTINVRPEDWTFQGFGEEGTLIFTDRKSGDMEIVPARYVVGETRWIRETFTLLQPMNAPVYRADYDDGDDQPSWTPSIFMPREYCRLLIDVTRVKVERLLEMPMRDAQKEGFGFGINGLKAFLTLWDQLNERRGFGVKKNPWVWVVDFEVNDD